jgi:hypothetical protein
MQRLSSVWRMIANKMCLRARLSCAEPGASVTLYWLNILVYPFMYIYVIRL